MAATFQLELVAADRIVWSGEATMVIARTLEGEVGILANHAPLLGVLAPGTVEIRPDDGSPMIAAVDGGFLSVANNRISILAERAELADDIDLAEAQRELERGAAAAATTASARSRPSPPPRPGSPPPRRPRSQQPTARDGRTREEHRCRGGRTSSMSSACSRPSRSLCSLFLFVRRRVLSRQGGTFECSVRMRAPSKPLADGRPRLGARARPLRRREPRVVPGLLVLAAAQGGLRPVARGARPAQAPRRRGVLAVCRPHRRRGQARLGVDDRDRR